VSAQNQLLASEDIDDQPSSPDIILVIKIRDADGTYRLF
jgi:hypothetical protein